MDLDSQTLRLKRLEGQPLVRAHLLPSGHLAVRFLAFPMGGPSANDYKWGCLQCHRSEAIPLPSTPMRDNRETSHPVNAVSAPECEVVRCVEIAESSIDTSTQACYAVNRQRAAVLVPHGGGTGRSRSRGPEERQGQDVACRDIELSDGSPTDVADPCSDLHTLGIAVAREQDAEVTARIGTHGHSRSRASALDLDHAQAGADCNVVGRRRTESYGGGSCPHAGTGTQSSHTWCPRRAAVEASGEVEGRSTQGIAQASESGAGAIGAEHGSPPRRKLEKGGSGEVSSNEGRLDSPHRGVLDGTQLGGRGHRGYNGAPRGAPESGHEEYNHTTMACSGTSGVPTLGPSGSCGVPQGKGFTTTCVFTPSSSPGRRACSEGDVLVRGRAAHGRGGVASNGVSQRRSTEASRTSEEAGGQVDPRWIARGQSQVFGTSSERKLTHAVRSEIMNQVSHACAIQQLEMDAMSSSLGELEKNRDLSCMCDILLLCDKERGDTGKWKRACSAVGLNLACLAPDRASLVQVLPPLVIVASASAAAIAWEVMSSSTSSIVLAACACQDQEFEVRGTWITCVGWWCSDFAWGAQLQEALQGEQE
eukprot:4309485-Amphidinium_carterae.1